MAERATLFLSTRLPPERAAKKAKAQLSPEDDLALQEQRCRAYASRWQYQVTDVYREVLPDLPEQRPELKALRTAMWLRRYDVVVVYSPDRLYLDPDRVARFLEEARVLGMRVEFLDVPEPYVWVVKEHGWPRRE
ncbi:recombinase family protein [Thermorudis peleae]|uniref:recombinase family protein n=1 Tax=Thermorudis peleae TaxID=1382356 RepID=UPI00056EA149|nr:recombinase family protein [Thermorudis peleae]